MRRTLLLILLCSPSFGSIAIAHGYVQAGLTGLTATTSGNNFYAITDSSTTPSALAFNAGGSFTKYTCLSITTISNLCLWFNENIPAGKTSLSCTGCGSVFSLKAMEVSGATATNAIDHISVCYNVSQPCYRLDVPSVLAYHPSYNSEAILYSGNCTSSATTVTGTGITLTTGVPSGEPGGYGTVSSTSSFTIHPDSGCGGNTGIIVGVTEAGATQTCSFDLGFHDVIAQLGSSGNPSITANIAHTGDLVVVRTWGINGITVSSVALGTDTLTAGPSGSSSATTGQPFIHYDLSTGVSGAQTLTSTISGTRTHSQVAYQEFIPGRGCTVSHDVDAGPGTNVGTTTATNPSITPTGAGELLVNYTLTTLHATAVNSPWTAIEFMGDTAGNTGNDFDTNTVNSGSWVLSGSSGATANNISIISGDSQAIMTSFILTGSAVPVKRRRAIVINN